MCEAAVTDTQSPVRCLDVVPRRAAALPGPSDSETVVVSGPGGDGAPAGVDTGTVTAGRGHFAVVVEAVPVSIIIRAGRCEQRRRWQGSGVWRGCGCAGNVRVWGSVEAHHVW